MTRFGVRRGKRFTAGLRVMGGKAVLFTPGIKRARRRRIQKSSTSLVKMVKP